MADRKITEFGLIDLLTLAAEDVVPVVDVSLGAALQANRKATLGVLREFFQGDLPTQIADRVTLAFLSSALVPYDTINAQVSSRLNVIEAANWVTTQRIAGGAVAPASLSPAVLDMLNGAGYAGLWSPAVNFPAGSVAGQVWLVIAAGSRDGQAFTVGDRLVALVNGASATVYAGNWVRVQQIELTQTSTDTTPGRAMKAGDWGLGGAAIEVTDLGPIAASGRYRISQANSVAGRAPSLGFWLVDHLQHDGSSAVQIAMRVGTSIPEIWQSVRQSGVWGSWYRVQVNTQTRAWAGSDLNPDSYLTEGVYFGSWTGLPGGTRTAYLQVFPGSDSLTGYQVAYNNGLGLIWYRRRAASVFDAWRAMVTQNTIVGTVSQSGGVPTGAAMEPGSNANGEFKRYADGTMECWRTLAASAAAGVVWTFPAAFSAPPVVNGNAVATVLSGVTLDALPTTTTVTLSARDKADARRADTMHLTAKGRWF